MHDSIAAKPKFKRFINKRDQALEDYLLKIRARVSSAFARLITETVHICHTYYPNLPNDLVPKTQYNNLEKLLSDQYLLVGQQITHEWMNLRRFSYIVSNAGMQQAITNTGLGRGLKPIDQSKIKKSVWDETLIGTLNARINLALNKIMRDVMNKVQVSKVMDSTWDEARKRILSAFPKPEIRKQLRTLSSIKEAAKKSDLIQFDFVGPDEWEEIVNDYLSEYIPAFRDPRAGELDIPVSPGKEGAYIIYPWDLEREITEDFVMQVRNGEHDGAKAVGVEDFVWTAILDDATDECCEKRDTFTTREIQAKIDSGEITDGLGTAPPIHFGCRCALYPSAKGLAEISDFTEEEFDDWLSK